ncbi:N-acetylneuraminate synthase family protein [Flavobacterium johnsoniae]|uniref:N-acetylneuraminate synthase n=1 Tax=Flavobacterium johnsoniae TaxID=986 RepID=A0A1J7CNT6_FLAJO|nr:N-acetylneuraminate synthase family protein [Flavobacterium johnsoniae]OIV43176.1 N-acetylneuraminate synthase [Flavobacterium johnsoniae]
MYLKEPTPYIIAEIGQAHDGSLGMLYSYIDAVAQTGANAVKFQMHIAEAESSEFEPFRVKFSLEDNTRFDYWKRMGFSLDQWKGIKKHCDTIGLDFICSPFSNMAVDWLEEIGISCYKIGSGEVNNFLILEKIARTGKPVIISSGMSSYTELDETVTFLKERNVSFSILQCMTAYPTQPEQYGFNIISELKMRYDVPVGFSDHSAKKETCIAATALGASILEFHVVFDRGLFGPDSKASLTLYEAKELIEGVRNISKSLLHPVNKNNVDSVLSLKQIFEKSLAVNKNLPKGHILSFEDLEAKKPTGYGIKTSNYKDIIGRPLKSDMKQWDFLNEEDLA